MKYSLEEKLRRLNEIGIALSAEPNHKKLLKKILMFAKDLTGADAGTLYLVTPKKTLSFAIVSTDSLNYHVEADEELAIKPFKEVPLFKEDKINKGHIVAYAVNTKKSINIDDVYKEGEWDFAGTKEFDAETGYQTRSVLTVPILDRDENPVGALQLINSKHEESGAIIPFTLNKKELAESLASQAGVALRNQALLLQLKNLFYVFVRLISEAIDEKSPTTANHGKRVPILATMLAEAVNETDEGPLKGVEFSKAELEELELAAFLHDCGKILTPEYIMDKKTKLSTIWDRIDLVNARFDNALKEEKIAALEKKVAWLEKAGTFPDKGKAFQKIDEEFLEKERKIAEEKSFVDRCNRGKEIMDEKALTTLSHLLQKHLITEDEGKNLKIPYGTLNEEERKIMEHHVVATEMILNQLPFPKELEKVPDIATAHHERVDGKGYPKGLTKEEMLVQARILAIADVFEALSAPDRPYKHPLPLSEIYSIMKKKCEEGALDADLFDIFLKKNVGLRYGIEYLDPVQLDVLQPALIN